MRKILIGLAVALGLGLASPAWAAATIFSTDCAAGITVTGSGLIVTHTGANAQLVCRANNPKYSGKWYYEGMFTVTDTQALSSFGVGNNGASQPINGGLGLNLTIFEVIGSNSNSAGIFCNGATDSRMNWLNSHTTPGAACVVNKKIGVALNLDYNPPQMWVTPDVTSLLCDGAGGSGSTNPQWNGSCTSDPSIPGTGGPTNGGGGVGIFLAGTGYFPAFDGYGINTSVTFNFGASAFTIASVPSGFSSWDTAGGDPTVPGPLSPQNINLANAPGWAASTSYPVGSRVVAGPGWTPGSPGSFTSGSNLYLWALTGAGGTSGGSAPAGFASCATPAGVGGGLNGVTPTGWSGKTTVSDNGLTWTCLKQIDYVTLTGMFNDTSTDWATSQTYPSGTYVQNAGHLYLYGNGGAVGSCTTAGSGGGPTGTTIGGTTSDNTCTWIYVGERTYSSKANIWPHQLVLNVSDQYEEQFTWNVVMTVWYGGSQRPEYVTGSNGESVPIMMDRHSDLLADKVLLCKNGFTKISTGQVIGSPSCNGVGQPWIFTLTAATGDSFQENVLPASQPLRYDSSKGVSFFSNQVPSASKTYYQTQGEPVGYSDNFGAFTRIQQKSAQGICFAGHGTGGPGGQHTNQIIITQGIWDCNGSTMGALWIDSGMVVTNNLVVLRGTPTGGAAINLGYPGPLNNNTIVCNSGTNVTAVQTNALVSGFFGSGSAFFPPPWKNNIMVGCAVNWANNNANGTWASTLGANNATDLASGASGTFTGSDGSTYTKLDLPGVGSTCVPPANSSSCLSLSASALFINPTIGSTMDFRLKSPQSPVYGAGATFSFATGGSMFGTLGPGNDVFNTARPIGSRYDIGAEMFIQPLGGFLYGPFGEVKPASPNWQAMLDERKLWPTRGHRSRYESVDEVDRKVNELLVRWKVTE